MLFSETAHRTGILPIIIERIKTPLPKAHKSNAIVRAQNIDKEATSTTIASQKSFGVLWSNGDGMDGWMDMDGLVSFSSSFLCHLDTKRPTDT